MLKHAQKSKINYNTVIRSRCAHHHYHQSGGNKKSQNNLSTIRRRKRKGRSSSRSWPGTPNTLSIASTTSSEV